MPDSTSYVCAHCGHHFAGARAYDRHRVTLRGHSARVCAVPWTVGLVRGREGRWELPESER